MSNNLLYGAYEDEFATKSYLFPEQGFYCLVIKRIMGSLFALIGMVVGFPLIILFGILIKLESRGPMIFKQKRVGKNGRIFDIYKLRSMYADAEKDGPIWAKLQDSRVTKVGRFMRRTRIDEIPQLINVLLGDMSIVGPRPERPYFTEMFSKNIPRFTDRLCVRPGITGLAQINGGYDITPLEKFNLDAEYIKSISLFTDLKIILRTVIVILTGRGAR